MQISPHFAALFLDDLMKKIDRLERKPQLARALKTGQIKDPQNRPLQSLSNQAYRDVLTWYEYLVRDAGTLSFEVVEGYMRLLEIREGYVPYKDAKKRLKERRNALDKASLTEDIAVPLSYRLLTQSTTETETLPPPNARSQPVPRADHNAAFAQKLRDEAEKRRDSGGRKATAPTTRKVRVFQYMTEREVQSLGRDYLTLAHALRDPRTIGHGASQQPKGMGNGSPKGGGARTRTNALPILEGLQNEFKRQGLKKMPRPGAMGGVANIRFTGKADPMEKYRQKLLDDSDSAINALVGLKDVKEQYKDLIALFEMNALSARFGLHVEGQAQHMIFAGPPGTCKTTVAEMLGEDLYHRKVLSKGHFTKINARDLIAPYMGQTEGRTKEALEAAKGGVLFIDEAYALTHGDRGADDYAKNAIAILLDFMEENRDDIIIICAGYPQPMEAFLRTNEGLASRFKTVLNFPHYSAEELLDIFDYQMEHVFRRTCETGVEDYMKSLIDDELGRADPHFGNGRFIRKVIESAQMKMSRRLSDSGVLTHFRNAANDKDPDLTVLKRLELQDFKAVDLQKLRMEIDTGKKERAEKVPMGFQGPHLKNAS